ncbi:IS3 family transposase [Tepidimicrobium xylanilyticum]|uniref:Integrase core domain-containing protein n=1 Tax=Tepidimicrobium xylanilyticum TaxID=1123352 RepID=A0A1H3EEL2_9FIRM|nr:IS3 family transposase [Tepidimicrobium xylanilyticum]SDX77163.1 Integrase core domain-containing protein [Tepidimicrobium xylanilyticum]
MQSPYFIVIWNSNTLIIPFKAGIFYRKKFETLGELRERIAEYINVYNKDRFLMCKIFLIKLLVYLTRISSLVDACVTFSLGFIAISSNSSMSRYVDLSSSIIVAVYLIKNGIITIKSREDFVFGNKTLH